jgi:hypothetical protein
MPVGTEKLMADLSTSDAETDLMVSTLDGESLFMVVVAILIRNDNSSGDDGCVEI